MVNNNNNINIKNIDKDNNNDDDNKNVTNRIRMTKFWLIFQQKPYWALSSSRRNYNLVIFNDRLMSETLSLSDGEDGIDGTTPATSSKLGSSLTVTPHHLATLVGRSPLNSTPGK